jgi:hypothetical protein
MFTPNQLVRVASYSACLAYFSRTFPNEFKTEGTVHLYFENYGNTNLGLVRSVVRSQSAQQNQWCHKNY